MPVSSRGGDRRRGGTPARCAARSPMSLAAQDTSRGRRLTLGLAFAVAAATSAAGLPSASAAEPSQVVAAEPPPAVADPASYVNPFIGTTNAGNVYPGAVTPFGMLSWSPQTSRGTQVSNPAPG